MICLVHGIRRRNRIIFFRIYYTHVWLVFLSQVTIIPKFREQLYLLEYKVYSLISFEEIIFFFLDLKDK